MARPDKAAAVAELAEEFRTSEGAVLTDYRGLTVSQLQELRRVLGDSASYAVVKNTLTKIAAGEAGVAGFDDLLVGPTAIAFIKGDAVEVTKSLRDFARANPPLIIKGGILDGKPLTVGEIAKIADLESREVLLGKMAGALLASLHNAVSLFNAPLAQAARLIGAFQAKVEADQPLPAAGGDSAEAPAPEPAADEVPEQAADEVPEPAADEVPEQAADPAPELAPDEAALPVPDQETPPSAMTQGPDDTNEG